MRLVFLSHDSNHNGGAQKCLVDLFKGLKRRYSHCEIYVIFPSEGELIDTCMPYIDGYKIISMPWWLLNNDRVVSPRKKISFVFKVIKKAIKIRSYLRLVKPDYGITNTIVLPYLALACKIMSIKHLWFIHEIPATWNDRRFIFSIETVYKWVNKLSSRIIVPSEFAKAFYAKVVTTSKIVVVNQAVDAICTSERKVHERYTILLVGTFDSNKGQLELLQAVKRIIDAGRDLNCYLVGSDAGYLPACEKFISLNKLENNVVVVPFTDNIQSYYLLSDVLVVCSGFETFGRVAVEAQKCGLPVILSNVGANPERIQDGVTGLLYKKGDIDDLVYKIEILRDECKRNEFVAQIKQSELDQYSIVNFASQFYELLG
ncbi:glycosyltransferase family 4 protein [Bacteroides sp.]|uniref:glycosyltransferase family 4 protein n=1 Tax=Bacteroides sp. TaxID=29523 RepID=UPI0025C2ED23|nr:glycosyltransferase family 4 protein [Bacteroides sp.]